MHTVTVMIDFRSSFRKMVLKWIKIGGGIVEDVNDPDKIVGEFETYEKARNVSAALAEWQDSMMIRRN